MMVQNRKKYEANTRLTAYSLDANKAYSRQKGAIDQQSSREFPTRESGKSCFSVFVSLLILLIAFS